MLTLLLTLTDDSTRTIACGSADYAHGYVNALRDANLISAGQWQQSWIEINRARPALASPGAPGGEQP